jgi:CheY-like chemotaxis protein
MPSKKILVVDDNPSIRFVIRSLVEAAGFTVCGEAGNGIEAIEKAQQVNPDLILLDLSMPRMTGAEAAPVLKSQMPHVPIILFTLHDDTVGEALAAAMGVDRVIAKPDGMTKLVECVRNVLGITPE